MQINSLTLSQAAKYINCSVASLRVWNGNKTGPHFFRAGRLIRYRKEELDHWIEQRKDQPCPKKPKK